MTLKVVAYDSHQFPTQTSRSNASESCVNVENSLDMPVIDSALTHGLAKNCAALLSLLLLAKSRVQLAASHFLLRNRAVIIIFIVD